MSRAITWVALVAILVMYIRDPPTIDRASGGVVVRPIQHARELIVVPPPAQFGPERTFDQIMRDVLERR